VENVPDDQIRFLGEIEAPSLYALAGMSSRFVKGLEKGAGG
jgi:hypothetical protein